MLEHLYIVRFLDFTAGAATATAIGIIIVVATTGYYGI